MVKQGDYVIGSGDLLGVDVFDVAELSRDVRVNESGFISLPLMPAKVRAEGLTTFQLQDKLAELLQTNGLVSSPQVSVSLKERNSQPITIIGSVKTPMVIQAVRQTTLLQALSQAGGIGDDAGNTVIVTRPAEKSLPVGDPNAPPIAAEPLAFTINLADLLETGDARFNIPLLGGDVVSVPRAGIIYVVGAVVRPGGFVMQNDRDRMTTLKMLSLAGGPNNTAKIKSAVILRKNPDTGKRDELPRRSISRTQTASFYEIDGFPGLSPGRVISASCFLHTTGLACLPREGLDLQLHQDVTSLRWLDYKQLP